MEFRLNLKKHNLENMEDVHVQRCYLNHENVTTLKKLCKLWKFQCYSHLKKKELVEYIILALQQINQKTEIDIVDDETCNVCFEEVPHTHVHKCNVCRFEVCSVCYRKLINCPQCRTQYVDKTIPKVFIRFNEIDDYQELTMDLRQTLRIYPGYLIDNIDNVVLDNIGHRELYLTIRNIDGLRV